MKFQIGRHIRHFSQLSIRKLTAEEGRRSIAHVRLQCIKHFYFIYFFIYICWELGVEEERKKVIDHFDNDEQLTQYTRERVHVERRRHGEGTKGRKEKKKRRMTCPVKSNGKVVRRTV